LCAKAEDDPLTSNNDKIKMNEEILFINNV